MGVAVVKDVDGFSIKTISMAVVGSLLGLIILVSGCKSFVSIPAGNRGVVMAFGQVEPGVLPEGLHMIVPYRDTVKIMSVQVLRDDLQMIAASGDMQDVSAVVAVNWSINPEAVNKVFQTVG